MGSESYDWLRFIVGYTLARLGLLLALVLFGAFTGAILFPSLVTFLPYSMVGVKNFLTQPNVESVIGTVVICLFLIWVFFDDARKHTAYEEWSMTTILTVLILIGMFYFIPAIFRDSFHAEGKGEVFYMVLYYPAKWVTEVCVLLMLTIWSDIFCRRSLTALILLTSKAFSEELANFFKLFWNCW